MDRYLGIDAGSRFVKYAVVSGSEVMESGILPSGEDISSLGSLGEAVSGVGFTGYGRSAVSEILGYAEPLRITEISAAAAGFKFLNRPVRTIIDIGGQDTKIISVSDSFRVQEFYMNDKCAAGTGKFIEMVLNTLGVSFEEAEALETEGRPQIGINSTCAVFAETEIIQLRYKGYQREDLLSSVFESIARKIAMQRRAMILEPVLLTGGAACFNPLIEWFSRLLKTRVHLPDEYRLINAIGAASAAKRGYSKT